MCALNRSVSPPPAPAGLAAKQANKHQLRTEATKKKLLAAAYQIFTRDGFEAARIEEIAAVAGFTRGAYYAHFESKTDIFFALLEEKVAESRERVAAILSTAETPEGR